MSAPDPFDPERSWSAIEARIAEETSPRRRALLEQVRDHIRAEIRGELAPLMATLTDEPRYHFRGAMPEVGPKGRDAVQAFYEAMIAGGGNRFHLDVRRIVVDDDAVVTEGAMRQVTSGSALVTAGLDTVEGQPVDPEGAYVTESWILTVWPRATDGRLEGEDIYFGSPPHARVWRLPESGS